MDTPILFLGFNRPEQTKKVFEQIRKQRPATLYIALDGPRKEKSQDTFLCAQVKEVFTDIDWACNIRTLYRELNLGSKYAVSQAIDWFFSEVDYGIILEDDCLPNDSFFSFTTENLRKYMDAPQIMMVTGCSFQPNQLNQSSYYFSKYVHVWGWGTWRRAWKLYKVELSDVTPNEFDSVLRRTFAHKRERKRWIYNFHLILNGLDAWDYQWMYWIWKNNGLTIIPWKNMISNIGFGEEATHTFDVDSEQSKMAQHTIDVVIHPKAVRQHVKADKVERYRVIIVPVEKLFEIKIAAVLRRILKLKSSLLHG